MLDTNSTEKQLNRLSEFREAAYQHSFGARRDALLELLDALLLKAPAGRLLSSKSDRALRTPIRRRMQRSELGFVSCPEYSIFRTKSA
jgi:hypothetical protein